MSGRGRPPLTATDVHNILTRYANGEASAVIARDYGISPSAVRWHAKRAGLERQSTNPRRGHHKTPNRPTLLDRPQWMDQALCAQTDPEAFFPEKGGSTREAKQVCSSCTVRAECLDHALAHDERFGVWGGLSERDRRPLHDLTEETA